MGQSKSQKEYNRMMASNAQQQLQLQREMFEHNRQGTPGEQRFERDAQAWNTWIGGKNYGAPPPNSILNFDLYTPSKQAEMRNKIANISGIGAAAMSGTGDQSIAVAQSRDRMANEMSQMQGAAYENAVKGQDAYYKGSQFQWSGLGAQTNANLLGNATSSAQFFFDQQRQTLPPSFWQVFSPVVGGAISAAGSLLGNPGLFGGR